MWKACDWLLIVVSQALSLHLFNAPTLEAVQFSLKHYKKRQLFSTIEHQYDKLKPIVSTWLRMTTIQNNNLNNCNYMLIRLFLTKFLFKMNIFFEFSNMLIVLFLHFAFFFALATANHIVTIVFIELWSSCVIFRDVSLLMCLLKAFSVYIKKDIGLENVWKQWNSAYITASCNLHSTLYAWGGLNLLANAQNVLWKHHVGSDKAHMTHMCFYSNVRDIHDCISISMFAVHTSLFLFRRAALLIAKAEVLSPFFCRFLLHSLNNLH